MAFQFLSFGVRGRQFLCFPVRNVGASKVRQLAVLVHIQGHPLLAQIDQRLTLHYKAGKDPSKCSQE